MTLKYGSSGIPMGKIQGGSGGSGGGVSIVIVTELPEIGESGVFYLVPATGATSPNIYTEYIWIADENRYEKIGDKEVDLSNYYTKTETYNKTEVEDLVATSAMRAEQPLEVVSREGTGKAYIAGTTTEVTDTAGVNNYITPLISGPYGYDTGVKIPGFDARNTWEFMVQNTPIVFPTAASGGDAIVSMLEVMSGGNGSSFIEMRSAAFDSVSEARMHFVSNMGTTSYQEAYVNASVFETGTMYDFRVYFDGTTIRAEYKKSSDLTWITALTRTPVGLTTDSYNYIKIEVTDGLYVPKLEDVSFTCNNVLLYQGGIESTLKLNYNSTLELDANNKLGVSSSVSGYTKAETDELLDEKQDVFTTEAPLEMSSITRGGVYNITTSSGRIVNDYQQALTFDSNTSGVVAISNANISNYPSTLSEFFTGNCSYFDIPTDAGARIANGENFVDRIWLNCGAIDSYYYPMFIWGNMDADGEFTPVLFQRGYYTGGMFGGFVDSVSNVDTNTINLNCTTYSDTSNSASGGSGYGYRVILQYVSSSQTIVSEIDRQNSAAYNWNGCHTQNPAILANAKKINMVRVFAWMSGGFPPVSVTYSINGTDTDWNINDAAITSTSLELNYDDNTLGIDNNNKLYAKSPTINTKEPLANERVQLGGPVNFDLTSGSMVPTYPINVNATGSGSNIVFSNSTLTAQPGTLADIFSGNVSYIDIPTDYGERVANYQDGSGSNYDCSIALIAERSSSVNTNKLIALFCNKSDSGEITPYIIAQATCNSTASNACAYLGETITGTSTTDLTVDTLAISSTVSTGTVSTASNQLQFNLSYNGSNWNLSATGYSASGSSSNYYARNIAYADSNRAFMTRLRNCNCIRLFFYNTTNTQAVCANNTDTYIQYYGATTGWVTQPWRVTDEPVYKDSLILKYDNTTLGVNGSGNLYAKNAITNPQGAGVYLNNGKLYLDLEGDSDGYLDVTISDVDVASSTVNVNTSKFAAVGMPSSTYTDITLGASGSSYTAPANGWVVAYMFAAGADGSMQNFNLQTGGATDDTVKIQDSRMNVTGTLLTCTIPVLKNETFYTVYSATGRLVFFRFYYAVGSESEAQ